MEDLWEEILDGLSKIMKELSPAHYFEFANTEYAPQLQALERVWQAIDLISEWIRESLTPGIHGQVSPYAQLGKDIYIGEGTTVLPGTIILGPAIIGRGCTIGPNAYIRQNVILADNVHVGHVCEVKNALILEGALVPHFSYVGDSVLGVKAHLGAGVKLSNVRIDGRAVPARIDGQKFETGLKKFGAILGDCVEVGCNAVLNPGTLVAPRTLIAGCMLVGGYFPPDSFVTHGHAPETESRR